MLRIGFWPGRDFTYNAFVGQFIHAMEAVGAVVHDVDDPRTCGLQNVDVLIIQWPEEIFWRGSSKVQSIVIALTTLRALRRLRAAGVKLVWLVHNLKPHDASGVKQLLWRLYTQQIVRLIHAYATLSPGTLDTVSKALGMGRRTPRLALRHPSYGVDRPLQTRAEARRLLRAPDSPRLLALPGVIKHYKSPTRLAECVAALGVDVCSLVIAGRTKDVGLRKTLEQLDAENSNIVFREGRLSNEDFVTVIRASDYVVVPFVETLHSGSLVHALSVGRAVLTPRTGFSEDLAKVAGPDWVKLYDGPIQQDTIRDLPPPPVGAPDLTALSPEVQARAMLDFLKTLMGEQDQPA